MNKSKETHQTNKFAAIYIRVSTDAQFEEGYSVEAQKEMLGAYCISKGIKNYRFYIDGGFSGSNLNRPALEDMIADIKADKIDSVLVYKLDRLSRSQKDTLYLIEDVFNPKGVDFVSLNESMDTSTPLGRLMLGILSAFAQLERENIKERTRMGMKERVKAGLWPGGGRVPFGYDYDPKNGILVPNKDAKTVKKIYDLYLKGYSPRKIASLLRLKYERLVLQILTRRSNLGYITYNGEEYKGKHDPIISEDLFNSAMLLMNRRSRLRATEPNNLLTGLLYCGVCGAKMRYQKWGKNGYKIVCYSRDKSKPHLVKDENCENLLFWADEIESLILKDIFLLKFKLSKSSASALKSDVFEMLKSKKNELEKKLKRLYMLFAEDSGDILKSTIDEVKKEILKTEEQMISEKKNNTLKNELNHTKERIKTLEQSWNFMTALEKRELLRSIVEKIVINPDGAKIYYKFDF